MPKVADFCLSRFLDENQYQAIASKQFGSMWPIEIGMDSSSVVQVSSLMECSTDLFFEPAYFSISTFVASSQWMMCGSEVHLRDAGKPSSIGLAAELKDIQAEAQGATSCFRGDKPGRMDDLALKIDPSAHTP